MGTLQRTLPDYRITPPEALIKYKHTERHGKKCEVCGANAYYYYVIRGYLCSPHLLDLVNIGEINWKWADWEEVWDRTGIMLDRSKKNV